MYREEHSLYYYSCFMEKNISGLFNLIKDDVKRYVDLRLKLLKVETYEKAGQAAAVCSLAVIILLIVFFAIFFLFLGLGCYLGQVLGNLALGIALVGVLYLLLLVLVLLLRHRIMDRVFGLFVRELMEGDAHEEK